MPRSSSQESSEASDSQVIHILGYPLMILACLDLHAPRAEVLDPVPGDKVYAAPSAILTEGHGLQRETLRIALSARHALPPAAKRDVIMEEYNRSASLFLVSIALLSAQMKHRRSCARVRELRSDFISPRQNRSWVGVRL